MWALLTQITDKGGLIAGLFASVVLVCVLVVRELWQQNQKLHEQIRAVHEKRVEESQEIIERVVQHVENTKHFMDKVREALDVLIALSKRR